MRACACSRARMCMFYALSALTCAFVRIAIGCLVSRNNGVARHSPRLVFFQCVSGHVFFWNNATSAHHVYERFGKLVPCVRSVCQFQLACAVPGTRCVNMPFQAHVALVRVCLLRFNVRFAIGWSKRVLRQPYCRQPAPNEKNSRSRCLTRLSNQRFIGMLTRE